LLALALTLQAPELRAQTAGQLDPTFGTNGAAVVNFDPFQIGRALMTAIQPDGKIVVAGHSGFEFAAARFNEDGTLDTGFGTDGRTSVNVGASGQPLALFLESDGKILIAGEITVPVAPLTAVHFVRLRLDANGVPDETFGPNGVSSTNFGFVIDVSQTFIRPRITAITRQTDGSFLVAGTRDTNFNDDDLLLARYSRDGVKDTSIGTEGLVSIDVAGENDAASAILFQPDDGKIVLVGSAGIGGDKNLLVARLDTDGNPDETFGDGGFATADFQGDDEARAAVLLADGRILVSGNNNRDLTLVRLLPDGRRDLTFDGDGKATVGTNDRIETGFAIVMQEDGKAVIAGGSRLPTSTNDVLLARINDDGSRDLTFGVGGLVVNAFSSGIDLAFAAAIQPDGKIVAAGTGFFENSGFLVARFEKGEQADLSLTKVAPTSPVNVGERFDYTIRVVNHGPDAARDVLVTDRLPAEVTLVSCEASSSGVCGTQGSTQTVRFDEIGAGSSRTITFRVTLNALLADGVVISNTASVASADAVDVDPTNNTATATIVTRATPHTLRFFLHGHDIPGTAGGFTMSLAPARAQAIALNLRNAPTWFSDPALNGVARAGATYRLVRPCTLGLNVAATYRLSKTNLAGGNEQVIGQTQRLVGLCLGQEVISIPVTAPVAFANERLRLTISSTIGVNLDLQLGEGTFLDVTNFTGIP